MSILQFVTIAFLGIVFLLFLIVFLATFLAYRNVKKRIRYDQTRIEKGDSVLLRDSFLEKALYYADKDFNQKGLEDPLSIFGILTLIKVVFTLSQICLLFTLISVVILFFKEFTGESELSLSAFALTIFPVMACFIMSFMLIIYIKTIFSKLYTNQAYEQIKKNNDLLNALHKKILDSVSPATDANFYSKLNSATLEKLNETLFEDTPSQTLIEKRLVTLSLREYFMKEVPDYANSGISKLFTADAGNRTKDPAMYIRIDCTQTIQSYVYKHSVVLASVSSHSKSNEILSKVSDTLSEINQLISQFRLTSEPMVVLIENYFRVSTLFFFFMFIIIAAIIIGWYSLGCRLGKGVALIKFLLLKIWNPIRVYVFRRKEPTREAYEATLDAEFAKALGKECVPPEPKPASPTKLASAEGTANGTPAAAQPAAAAPAPAAAK